MKKVVLMILAFLVIFAGPTQAIMINGNNAGFSDNLLGQGDKLTNPQSEIDWAKGILGETSLTLSGEQQNVPYYQADSSIYYWGFELDGTPDYYVIKNATRIALFENRDSLDWAVFYTLALRDFNIPTDPWVISHVTLGDLPSGDPRTNSVPEALPFVLLTGGLGLLGLTRINRTKKA